MKVLLIGEMSSLHRYLKEGLQKVEWVDVTLATHQSNWKGIGGNDIVIFRNDSKGLKRIKHRYIDSFQVAKKFGGYDVVQFINPKIYSPLINKTLLRRIIENNQCVSLITAGCDYALSQAYNNHVFDYYMFDGDTKEIDAQILLGVYNLD